MTEEKLMKTLKANLAAAKRRAEILLDNGEIEGVILIFQYYDMSNVDFSKGSRDDVCYDAIYTRHEAVSDSLKPAFRKHLFKAVNKEHKRDANSHRVAHYGATPIHETTKRLVLLGDDGKFDVAFVACGYATQEQTIELVDILMEGIK